MARHKKMSLRDAEPKVLTYIDNYARRMLDSKKGVVDYDKIATKTNDKFGTTYSKYSIAARCGNLGLGNRRVMW